MFPVQQKINPGWTEERTESLVTLWRDGLSASQIAKRLRHITRNAVIGKLNRLGCHRDEEALAASRVAGGHAARRADRQKRMEAALARGHKPRPRAVRAAIQAKRIVCAEPPPHSLTILDIGQDQCRYPVGPDQYGDQRFCAHQTEPDGSWCPHHAGRVFQKAVA